MGMRNGVDRLRGTAGCEQWAEVVLDPLSLDVDLVPSMARRLHQGCGSRSGCRRTCSVLGPSIAPNVKLKSYLGMPKIACRTTGVKGFLGDSSQDYGETLRDLPSGRTTSPLATLRGQRGTRRRAGVADRADAHTEGLFQVGYPCGCAVGADSTGGSEAEGVGSS